MDKKGTLQEIISPLDTLGYIESDLGQMGNGFTLKAEYAVAAVRVGGIGDWLRMFALSLRDSVPVIFVEVCVSLVEARLVSLGLMLGLFLQTFMAAVTSPGSQDSAGLFQFFLETYFIELLAVAGDGRRVALEAI